MSSASLSDRIKAEFDARSARQQKAAEDRTRQAKEHEQRMAQFVQTCEDLKALWSPKLDAFAKQFGNSIKVTPNITPSLREAKIAFMTDLANMTMTISVSTDPDITRLVFDYDLLIIPTFMDYDRHARFEMPLDAVDKAALSKWIDDQLIACVKAYLAMQDNEHYLRWSMVEDPISKTKLLRTDAFATIEHKGQKHYFVSAESLRMFKERHQIAQ